MRNTSRAQCKTASLAPKLLVRPHFSAIVTALELMSKEISFLFD